MFKHMDVVSRAINWQLSSSGSQQERAVIPMNLIPFSKDIFNTMVCGFEKGRTSREIKLPEWIHGGNDLLLLPPTHSFCAKDSFIARDVFIPPRHFPIALTAFCSGHLCLLGDSCTYITEFKISLQKVFHSLSVNYLLLLITWWWELLLNCSRNYSHVF